MPEQLSIISALTIGFAGGLHCIGMCGGISSALGFASGNNANSGHYARLLAYNLGRISSYTCIGFIFGGAGWLLGQQGMLAHTFLKLLSGALLIAIGLKVSGFQIGGLWRGVVILEKSGAWFWRRLQPLGKTLMPIDNIPKAFLFGMLWGWLPCGLVYAALAWSATSGSASQSALLMACFGFGTLPWLLATTLAGQKLNGLAGKRSLRFAVALVLVLSGLLTLATTLTHSLTASHDAALPGHHHHQ